MKIKENYILREVAGVKVAVPVGEATADFNGMLKLNSTAEFLWNALKTNTTAEELTEKLIKEYEVTPEKAASDVNKFLEKLREANCLED